MTTRKPKSAPAVRGDVVEHAGAAHEVAKPSMLAPNEITILAETFRLLGDPSRLKILLCCLQDSMSVGEIAERLDLSLSLVSHHLRLLRGARLVKGVRNSKQIFYEIADQHVSQMLSDMATHIAEDQADD
ncbi:ArsR/SmtB family transcription factor [Methylobacterium sp. sgz302541]|uniref:ArsR/SmtB family transcription factor n=1 Tax=unclassified Methylobacterium TaxID=2615210 RepID=UPI003D33C3BA